MTTDELVAEQAYVDHVYASLGAMRARTQRVFDRIMETGGFQELDHEIAYCAGASAALGASPGPSVRRIDEDEHGDRSVHRAPLTSRPKGVRRPIDLIGSPSLERPRIQAGVLTRGRVGAMTVPGPRSSAASSGSPPCAGQ